MHNLAIQHQIHVCRSHTSKVTKMSSINERTTCLFSYFLFFWGGEAGEDGTEGVQVEVFPTILEYPY